MRGGNWLPPVHCASTPGWVTAICSITSCKISKSMQAQDEPQSQSFQERARVHHHFVGGVDLFVTVVVLSPSVSPYKGHPSPGITALAFNENVLENCRGGGKRFGGHERFRLLVASRLWRCSHRSPKGGSEHETDRPHGWAGRFQDLGSFWDPEQKVRREAFTSIAVNIHWCIQIANIRAHSWDSEKA